MDRPASRVKPGIAVPVRVDYYNTFGEIVGNSAGYVIRSIGQISELATYNSTSHKLPPHWL